MPKQVRHDKGKLKIKPACRQAGIFVMLIGGHVSVAGGLNNAIIKGVEESFDVLQIFVSAPQSYRVNNYSVSEKETFVTEFKKNKFHALFFHAIYLINLVSNDERLVYLSKQSIIHYLQIGVDLGAVGTIVHLGSYFKNGTFEGVSEQLFNVLDEISKETPTGQFLIIENSAGGGGKIPKNLDEMVDIWKNCDQKKVRFCLDTQHLYASGVDVSDFDIFKNFLEQFDKEIGIEKVVCIHVNDSMTALGSGHDKHENIGEGKIGESGFKNILKQPLLQNIPLILEVPGTNRGGPDKENKKKLISLFGSA